MKINKITFKKNKYILNIDNKDYTFSENTIIKYNLLKPKEISDSLFKDILDYQNTSEAYQKALKYLEHLMRSKKDIFKKLNEYPKSTICEVINMLEKNNLINDEAYIKAFINDKLKLTLIGPKKIQMELEKNGFKNIEKYLNIDKETIYLRVNKIIQKKMKSYKGSYIMLQKKLKNDLIVMGYSENEFFLLDNINYDETESLKKDQTKYEKLYKNDELKVKQKLYQLGYRI